VLWRKRKTAFHSRQDKVNSKLYRESLLPKLIEDCKSCLLSGFIFQQDIAPAHTAKLAQNWIPPTTVTSSENTNGHWTNSPDLKPLDYHVWGVMRDRYKTFQSKPNTIDEESLTINVGRSATELKSTGPYTEHRQKTSSLCESWGRTLWTCFEINCFHRVFNW